MSQYGQSVTPFVGLADDDVRLVEACLCCLKTCFFHPEAPSDALYSGGPNGTVARLIRLMTSPTASASAQISVATIFTNACKRREHQDVLSRHGLVRALDHLLRSQRPGVRLPALQCLSFLVVGNERVASEVAEAGCAGEEPSAMLVRVANLLDRAGRPDTQLAAARCLTYLYRCGALDDQDEVVQYRVLPCLVRMTKRGESVETRILAAETLAHLIETSAHLQRVAAISNHLIPTMAAFLKCSGFSEEPAVSASNGNNNNNNGGGVVSRPPSEAAMQTFLLHVRLVYHWSSTLSLSSL